MVKGGSSGILQLLGTLKWLFTKWGAISVTLILILLSIVGTVQVARSDGDYSVVFKELGKDILNKDNKLYLDSVSIDDMGGLRYADDGFFNRLWTFVKSLGSLMTSFWYIYTFYLIFMWLATLFINNDSAKTAVFVLGGFFMLVFVTFGMIVPVGMSDVDKDLLADAPNYPFRGIVKFVSIVPLLFDNAQGFVGDNVTMNVTQEVVLPILDSTNININM